MKRIITATVQNKCGVLYRVASLLQRRQLNIESITVGPSELEGISKMTLVLEMKDQHKLEQLARQIDKQIDVLEVYYFTEKYIY